MSNKDIQELKQNYKYLNTDSRLRLIERLQERDKEEREWKEY
jgi:hypothetical protein